MVTALLEVEDITPLDSFTVFLAALLRGSTWTVFREGFPLLSGGEDEGVVRRFVHYHWLCENRVASCLNEARGAKEQGNFELERDECTWLQHLPAYTDPSYRFAFIGSHEIGFKHLYILRAETLLDRYCRCR